MGYKQTVILSLTALLSLSACGQPKVYPQGLTLSKLGPNMQDRMEVLLAPATTSETTQPSVKLTEASALHSMSW